MDKLWWNHITKAHKFYEDIVSVAAEGNSMVLSLPENVPWRNTLIDMIGKRLQIENYKKLFEQIKCPEGEVGLFLLRKYCKSEIRATYRYGMTYASFLGKCENIVLNDRYIWVTDIPKSKYEEWLKFIAEYNENVKNRTPAVFILETSDESFAHMATKGVKKLIFNQNITAYDKFAFCALAATENSCKEYMRPYLAELVSTICNEDIELCAICVNQGSRFLQNPLETIQRVTEEHYRSDGSQYRFSKKSENVNTLIWETQLKHIFPLIEKYRRKFVIRYAKQIQNILPIKNFFGENVTSLQEVEIGILVYMVGSGILSISAKEYEYLELYRDARNKLAHLGILELSVVEDILRMAD